MYIVPYHWWKDIVLISLVSLCVLFIFCSWRERKINKVKIEELNALMKTAEDELAALQQKMMLVNKILSNACFGFLVNNNNKRTLGSMTYI